MLSQILDSDKQICLQDEDYPYQSITPPIVQTTLFTFANFDDYHRYWLKKRNQYSYTRGNNPTTNILEEKLARLERGESCRVFASGMAAVSAAIIAHLKSGEHILFVNTIYAPTMTYAGFLERFNISHTYLRVTDIASIAAQLRPNTKMIFVESPGSLDMKIINLRSLAKMAKERQILTAIDNTYLTPLFQKPLELGLDISIHSCSKYIGGHSDVMAGAVITSKQLMHNIDEYGFKLHGAVLSPHDSFLILRGLRTMPARLEAIQESTREVVEYLQNHPRVCTVNHPLAYTACDRQIFYAQASGYTSLLSFELAVTDFKQLGRFVDKLKTFQIGVSWGGYENLVLPAYLGTDFAAVATRGEQPNLIRLALGLSAATTLIADLAQALEVD